MRDSLRVALFREYRNVMAENYTGHGDGPDYPALARQMLARRKIRTDFFNRQLFGEHAWDLLLLLMAGMSRAASVEAVGDALGISSATALSQARLLAGFDLVAMGDSTGSWSDIPIRLTDNATTQMQAYLDRLATAG